MAVREKAIVVFLLATACLTSCGNEESLADKTENTRDNKDRPVTDEYLAPLRDAAAQLGSELKQRLVTTIQDQGHVAAIEVCAEEAPQIAQAIATQTGLTVGRTALRNRNPENAPDQWESDQLENFMQQIADGADPSALEAWTIISRDGDKQLRWMKPIMVEAPCLACHGEAIAPDLRAAIDQRYPGDTATGFAPGDVRGAFTVARRLD
ncbi:MAG: DUF3365 domain-containing protein [Parvularculaceae bacterium]